MVPKTIVLSITPREQKRFWFSGHCALNEKGELACKGEPAEVASAAKQAISARPREQKRFWLSGHYALNEKGELACKGEPAEVASAAKQAISLLATRAKKVLA